MTFSDPHSRMNPRDVKYLKPLKFRHYVTISELARIVERDISWLRRLEKADRIPKAHRVKKGRIDVRLWSPKQVEEIKQIISTHRVGRPPNA